MNCQLLLKAARAALLWISLAISAASFAQQEAYVLGPEDIVTVTVLDQPKFSGEYTIPTSGTINLPVVGEVKASGMTLESLRSTAIEGLKKRLVNPEVTVSLKLARPRRIYVFGDVQKPGVLDLKPGWRIQESLSAAGGLSSGLEQRDVTVILERSATGKRVVLSLIEALSDTSADKLFLEPGDVLRLQSISITPVYVSGKVKNPGIYRMRENEAGILAALAQAGGVTDDANITAVRILRLNGATEVVDLAPALLEGQKVSLPTLNPGDMIQVSESQSRFVVLGYVAKPGYFSIPSGRKITLSQAIALAGGSEKRGRITRIGLVRLEQGKEVRKVYDLSKYLQQGDAKSNPELAAGDVLYVPETDKVDLLAVLSGLATGALFFDRIR